MGEQPMTAEERIAKRMEERHPEVLDIHDYRDLIDEHAAAAVEAVRAERDVAHAAIRESREFLARVARAYTQWMDAIGPRDTFAFPKDAEEHNGIVKHMHDMMALLVEFSEKCPPYTVVPVSQESALAAERAKVGRLRALLCEVERKPLLKHDAIPRGWFDRRDAALAETGPGEAQEKT